MKVTELQVGDYVCYNKPNGYVTRVDAIRRTGDATLGYVYSIDCKRDRRDPLCEKAPVDSFNVEILHPIDITPEILEKNGFVLSDEKPVVTEIGVAIIYGKYRRLDEDRMLNMGDNLYPIRYVHELHHALRLCGIDKEITLCSSGEAAAKPDGKTEKTCMYAKDNFSRDDRAVLCDGCEEECRFNKED